MSKPIEFKGIIEKIVRKVGTAEAQIVITVPTSMSIELPLGSVALTCQTLQASMFNKANAEASEDKPKRKKAAITSGK